MIPHFDLPFRFTFRAGIAQAAIEEQDTLEDVTNCVEMAVRYRQGQRFLIPQFGITDPAFETQPVNTLLMGAQIQKYESRAKMAFSQNPDMLDALVAKVRIGVTTTDRNTHA